MRSGTCGLVPVLVAGQAVQQVHAVLTHCIRRGNVSQCAERMMVEPVLTFVPPGVLGLPEDSRRQLLMKSRRSLLKAAALTMCDVCPGV